jgi:hypothetical protein
VSAANRWNSHTGMGSRFVREPAVGKIEVLSYFGRFIRSRAKVTYCSATCSGL